MSHLKQLACIETTKRYLPAFMGIIIFLVSFFPVEATPVPSSSVTFLINPHNKSTCIPASTQLVAKEVVAVLYEWEFNTDANFRLPGIIATSKTNTIVMDTLVTDYVKYYVRIRYKSDHKGVCHKWGPTKEITFGNSSPPIKLIHIIAEEVRPEYIVTYEVENHLRSLYIWSTIGGTIKSGQGTNRIVTDGKEISISVKESNQCLRSVILGNDKVVTRVRTPDGGPANLRTVTTVNPIPVPGVTDSSKYWIQLSKQPDFSTLVYDLACNSSDSSGHRWHPVWGTARFEYFTDYYIRVKVDNRPDYGDVVKLTTVGPRVWAINPSQGALITSGAISITLNTAVGATDYFLELDTTATFNSSSLIKLSSKKNTFPLTLVKFNRTYYIRAKANALQAGILYEGTWDKVVSFSTIEKPVTYLTTPVNGTVNWSKNASIYCYKIQGASSYDWELSASSDFSANVIKATKPDNFGNFKNLLFDNTTYYVRVKANVASQNIKGAWGPVHSFTTAAAVPVRIGLFDDQESASTVFVSPNPFTNEFRLNIDNTLSATVIITNTLGKVVAEYNGEISQMDLGRELKEGIYIINVIDSAGNKYVQRVVKIGNQ